MSWLFASSGQSIQASASVLSMNKVKVKVAQLCPTLCNPYGLYSPWNSPGQNTGVGSPSLLQEIFPTQGPNPGLPQCRRIFFTNWATREAKNTGGGSLSLLQQISLTQKLTQGLLHCRRILYPLSSQAGLMSFRTDWFDLFAVQGTLKSLLQHNSKASILQYSAFFMVQLSHPYTATGKTKALTRWTLVSKAMCLLFNTLSRFVIAFLPRSKHHLISWLQSLSTVIFGAQENKVYHCFHCFPICLPWNDGTRCHDLRFLNAEF